MTSTMFHRWVMLCVCLCLGWWADPFFLHTLAVHHFGKGSSVSYQSRNLCPRTFERRLCTSCTMWPSCSYCWWVVCIFCCGLCTFVAEVFCERGLSYLHSSPLEVVGDVTDSCFRVFLYISHNVSVTICWCFHLSTSSTSVVEFISGFCLHQDILNGCTGCG